MASGTCGMSRAIFSAFQQRAAAYQLYIQASLVIIDIRFNESRITNALKVWRNGLLFVSAAIVAIPPNYVSFCIENKSRLIKPSRAFCFCALPLSPNEFL